MSNTVLEWLNENASRSYPLVPSPNRAAIGGSEYVLADNVIIDANIKYTTIDSGVSLDSIEVTGGNAIFSISTGSVFTVPVAGPFPYYARLAQGSLLVVDSGVADIPEGYHGFNSLYFEDDVVNYANFPWLGLQNLSVNGVGLLTGTIALEEGYQFDINIPERESLIFGAASHYGDPTICINFSGEANDCGNIISFINGAVPSNKKITLETGNDIVILEDPANYRIFIGLAFDVSDICKKILPNPEV